MGIDNVLKPKSTEEIQDLEQRGFRKDKGKWRFTIDIKEIIEAYDQHEDVNNFRDSIYDLLLSKMTDVGLFAGEGQQEKFQEIADRFTNLGPSPDVEQVDTALEQLYDWADSNDVWINSF